MENVKELELLGLTEDDFDMLVDGLDQLPNKGQTGELLGELLLNTLIDDESKKKEFEKEREADKLEQKAKKQALTEDVRILQGKLLRFKRYLKENNLLH